MPRRETGEGRRAEAAVLGALADSAERARELRAESTTNPQRSETRWRGASAIIRSLSSWMPTLGSGRSDLPRNERDRLSARSYDCFRNQLIGRAAITRLRTSVVGVGIMPHADVDADLLGISDEQADELNTLINAEWNLYAYNPTEVDIEGGRDFPGLQTLAFTAALLGGDCFALTPAVPRAGGIYDLKLQLVDAARVTNPQDATNTDQLIDGVQLEPGGRPVVVYVRDRHPADSTGLANWTPERVFAESGNRRVLHITADRDQIGMVRAAPFLAPIIEPLQTLEVYARAELAAAVISAMFTVFLEHEAQELDEQGNPLPVVAGQTTKEGYQSVSMGHGAIHDLEPGTKASFANPSRPNSQYDPFFTAAVRQIGAAIEIPGDELLLAYNANYSAARASMLQAWRAYLMRRQTLVQQLCAPFRAIWFQEAVARGRIPVQGFEDPARRAAYMNAIWTGPARGAMDETREAAAAEARIRTGISNETIETAASTGEDWRAVFKGRVRELRTRERYNAPMPAAPGAGSNGMPAQAQPFRGGQPDPDDAPPREPGSADDEEARTEPDAE